MEEVNETRAERAFRTLLNYRQRLDEDAILTDLLTDLFTDIRHYCNQEAVDFNVVIANSQINYNCKA